ncbi:hypothetical protein [Kitasatospora sp. NPDC094011]|uniref:glycine-rich domain-containing protein n=1 Tax=Kitasatospora sp. NPDC094011 TaxID=3364090 RepID=UPI0038268223
MNHFPLSSPRRAVLVSTVVAASLLSLSSASAAPAPKVETFASPGEHTFTVPKGVSRIRVVALGGGGGGGGGGGNNDGPLSGGGGGGGGSGAAVSCLLSVKSGSTLHLTIGSGGAGGSGRNGRNNDGDAGGEGTATSVRIGEKVPVTAAGGRRGSGGDASGVTASGDSSSGGAGGAASASRCDSVDSKSTINAGNAGEGGGAGSSHSSGRGGTFGSPARYPDTCGGSSAGGFGGAGAVDLREGFNVVQKPSGSGSPGSGGCVVLTYATAADSA